MNFNFLFRKKSVSDILKQLEKDNADSSISLGKHLGVRDLAAFGIAAIIGAGIFSTIGKASADGGPAIIFLFVFISIACGFAAFAYAEFASMIPMSGSAYTYSYVAFGEITAWIIGWALLMEYGIGNITVAISWSDYFTSFLANLNIDSLNFHGIHLPEWMTMDYLTAYKGFNNVTALLESGKSFEKLDAPLQEAYTAWTASPTLGPLHIVADIPALAITILITWVVYRGIKESKNASNTMVIIKLCIVALVIAVGAFYVNTDNWHPFAPNGVSGILKGISAVFFAYIGFDAISTTAEECKNPQHDLPRGMMWAMIICTILYILIALVLTGMVKYNELAVGDPLAFVFEKLNLKWLSGIIAISAIVAMTSVLLVFQIGQPRIWMSISRDGLLPPAFSKIHPKYKTPGFSTIIAGFMVAVPALFMNITTVTDLCSIGTLFAFVLVCAGVLKLENDPNVIRGKFKTPYINSKFIMPLLFVIAVVLSLTYNKQPTLNFITNEKKVNDATTLITSLNREEIEKVKQTIITSDSLGLTNHSNDIEEYYGSLDEGQYTAAIATLDIPENKKYESGWNLFKHKIPIWIFIIVSIYLTLLCYIKKFSLIPVLGLESCLYMMSELGYSNWLAFFIWLFVGLIIYFSYGYKHSKLRTVQ